MVQLHVLGNIINLLIQTGLLETLIKQKVCVVHMYTAMCSLAAIMKMFGLESVLLLRANMKCIEWSSIYRSLKELFVFCFCPSPLLLAN